DFHTYAEMGWFEVRTSSIIANRLTELGYQVLTGSDVCLDESRMGLPSKEELEAHYVRALEQGAIQPYAERAKDGFTGVIGILDCGEGPVIAMRFDIDALGVFEEKGTTHRPSAEGFCSVNDGMMHACGHDGHATIGLAVAEILISMKDQLKGKLKLIFQPAEEGLRGAKPIVDHGHLDDVDFVIGNHMGNRGDREYDIGLSAGGTLASTKLDVTFTGKAAHAGGSPEKGDNAMLAAATAVLNLYALPRTSQGVTRVNVGTLQAGSGRNVIPDRATMMVEVRGSTTEANEFMEGYARRIIKAAADMHGCTCEIKLAGSASSLRSDMSMIERCQRVC
ncbi:MAG: amidohydrolase, partial [Oscillospiraceae bacterium]|nr:amidohydrolase [Oscillospiraceae bacterium]